jgi:hypothetical protein
MGSSSNPNTSPPPDNLVAHGNVIFVSFNYRLGVLASLHNAATADGGGLFGILDQQVALRWISRHIEAFGGDPGSVTLQGESAGAISICLHLVLPGSRGLFHRAILESSLCGFPFEDAVSARATAKRLAKALGCSFEQRAAEFTARLNETKRRVHAPRRQGLNEVVPAPLVPYYERMFAEEAGGAAETARRNRRHIIIGGRSPSPHDEDFGDEEGEGVLGSDGGLVGGVLGTSDSCKSNALRVGQADAGTSWLRALFWSRGGGESGDSSSSGGGSSDGASVAARAVGGVETAVAGGTVRSVETGGVGGGSSDGNETVAEGPDAPSLHSGSSQHQTWMAHVTEHLLPLLPGTAALADVASMVEIAAEQMAHWLPSVPSVFQRNDGGGDTMDGAGGGTAGSPATSSEQVAPAESGGTPPSSPDAWAYWEWLRSWFPLWVGGSSGGPRNGSGKGNVVSRDARGVVCEPTRGGGLSAHSHHQRRRGRDAAYRQYFQDSRARRHWRTYDAPAWTLEQMAVDELELECLRSKSAEEVRNALPVRR